MTSANLHYCLIFFHCGTYFNYFHDKWAQEEQSSNRIGSTHHIKTIKILFWQLYCYPWTLDNICDLLIISMTILAHPASVSSHYLYHHHLHIIILCQDPVHLWHNMVWCCCKQLQTRMSMSGDHTLLNSACIDEQKWFELNS